MSFTIYNSTIKKTLNYIRWLKKKMHTIKNTTPMTQLKKKNIFFKICFKELKNKIKYLHI